MLLANLSGSKLCFVDVAGKLGARLAEEGEAAMVAFALDWLARPLRLRADAGGQAHACDALEQGALGARSVLGHISGRAMGTVTP